MDRSRLAAGYARMKKGTVLSKYLSQSPGEASKLDAYVDAIKNGQNPTEPVLASDFGAGLAEVIAAGLVADAPPVTPPPAPKESPDNSVVQGTNGSIVDASGNTWTINATGQVAVNGTADSATSSVAALAYEGGKVWQKNSSNLWWSKSKPTDAWAPTGGTSTSPVPGDPTPPPPVTGKLFGIAPGAGGEGFNGLTSAKLTEYLDHMKSIGVQIMRFDHWDGGSGDDMRDAAVVAHGMDAIVMVANGNLGNAKAIATTALKHGIHKYELGNEPNINLATWGNSVQNYVNAANAAYNAIKAVDPQAIVSTGGICPYGQYGSKSADGSHWDQQIFLAELIRLGAKFDAVATHPYLFGDNMSSAAMLDKSNSSGGIPQALYLQHSLKAQLDAAGRTSTPIWFTESGAPTDGTSWSGGVSEAAQAELTAGVIALVKAEPRVALHCVYSGKDRNDNITNREGHFGLFRTDWSLKPAANAFKNAL